MFTPGAFLLTVTFCRRQLKSSVRPSTPAFSLSSHTRSYHQTPSTQGHLFRIIILKERIIVIIICLLPTHDESIRSTSFHRFSFQFTFIISFCFNFFASFQSSLFISFLITLALSHFQFRFNLIQSFSTCPDSYPSLILPFFFLLFSLFFFCHFMFSSSLTWPGSSLISSSSLSLFLSFSCSQFNSQQVFFVPLL